MKLYAKYLAVAAVLVSATSFARPATTWTKFYFSDATHTTAVGEETFTCNAQYMLDGEITPYYIMKESSCSSGAGI